MFQDVFLEANLSEAEALQKCLGRSDHKGAALLILNMHVQVTYKYCGYGWYEYVWLLSTSKNALSNHQALSSWVADGYVFGSAITWECSSLFLWEVCQATDELNSRYRFPVQRCYMLLLSSIDFNVLIPPLRAQSTLKPSWLRPMNFIYQISPARCSRLGSRRAHSAWRIL